MTYDTVLYYETWFQKSNIDHLIKLKYANKNILLINGMNKKIEFQDHSYHFELSSFRGILKSINALKELKKINCNQLVGVHITSHNALAYASLINYNELILIDDGIGTPAILMTKNFYWKTKYRFKFFIKIPPIMVLLLFLQKEYKSYSSVIQKISYYHFNFMNPTKIPGEKLRIYNSDSRVKTTNKTGFIGAPYVELGIIQQKEYDRILKRIIEKEGEILYFPHPFEKTIHTYKIEGLTIIDKKESFEEYAKKERIPNQIIGFRSTVLLNLKEIDKSINVFFIELESEKKIKAFKKILLELNVSKYNF